MKFEQTTIYIKEQNDRVKYAGNILIMLAQYLRKTARLPKNMWSKCYLAAYYLLNLILIKILDWLSPREADQKVLNREIIY